MKLFPDPDMQPHTCLIHGEIPAGSICSCTYADRLRDVIEKSRSVPRRSKTFKRKRRHVEE